MNLKETSRTGLQLSPPQACGISPAPRRPRLGPPQCCSVFKDHFRPQLSSPASPLRLSGFSRPLLHCGPAFYLASLPPSRTFLFFSFRRFLHPVVTSLPLRLFSLSSVPAATRHEYTASDPRRSRTLFQLLTFFCRIESHCCGCSNHLLNVSMIFRACSPLEILNFDLARYCPSRFW